jgi:predicted Rossmann-fold nucleotide-binding protein
MGLTRVAESDWLQPEFDRAAREAVFATHPEAMIVLPGAQGAASEAAQNCGQYG